MIDFDIKTGAAFSVSWVVAKQSAEIEQGCSHAQYSQNARTRHQGIDARIYPAHVEAICLPVVRRHSHRWAAYGKQCSANHAAYRSRASLQLPSRLLVSPLVAVETRSGIGGLDSSSMASRGASAAGRRRHGRWTSRQESLRQGLSSGRGTFDALLYGVSLGTQVGCAGNPGEVPLCLSSLGAARVGGFVPQPGMEQGTQSAPQDAGRTDAAVVGGDFALVSRAKVRFCRRRRLWNASLGDLRSASSPNVLRW